MKYQHGRKKEVKYILNISSNYDYRNQTYSTESLLKLLQKNSVDGTSTEQGLAQALGNTSQTSGRKPVSPFAGLVSDGTITSDQEQAIKEALESARMAYKTSKGVGNASDNNAFKDPLASLVTAGTITEDQKDAVKSALYSGKKHHGMPLPSLLSQEDSSDALTGVLDSLVDSGAITADMQKNITNAFQSALDAYSAQSNSSMGIITNSYAKDV
jgi:hypothetical protein